MQTRLGGPFQFRAAWIAKARCAPFVNFWRNRDGKVGPRSAVTFIRPRVGSSRRTGLVQSRSMGCRAYSEIAETASSKVVQLGRPTQTCLLCPGQANSEGERR